MPNKKVQNTIPKVSKDWGKTIAETLVSKGHIAPHAAGSVTALCEDLLVHALDKVMREALQQTLNEKRKVQAYNRALKKTNPKLYDQLAHNQTMAAFDDVVARLHNIID